MCNINNISNPDNLFPLADGLVLVGEDTGKHQNNALWVAKPCTGEACTVAPVAYTNPAENLVVKETKTYGAAAVTFAIASVILAIALGVILYL